MFLSTLDFSLLSYRRGLHTTDTGHKESCDIRSLLCLRVSVLTDALYANFCVVK